MAALITRHGHIRVLVITLAATGATFISSSNR
jgi:hypothetical protein